MSKSLDPIEDLRPYRRVIENLVRAGMRYGWELAKAGTEISPDPLLGWDDEGIPYLIVDRSHPDSLGR